MSNIHLLGALIHDVFISINKNACSSKKDVFGTDLNHADIGSTVLFDGYVWAKTLATYRRTVAYTHP